MKNYIILTSVLALAACGGGGGGVSTPASQPNYLRASTLIGNTDNNEITSMASAVVIKNGTSYSSVARAASAPDTASHPGYTIYKLDNVDFKLAGDENHTFNFEINDDGRIVRAVADDAEINRDPNDTTKFRGRIFQLVSASGPDTDLDTHIVTDDSTTQEQLDAWRDAYLAGSLHKEIAALTPEEKATVKWNYLEQEWSFDTSGSDKGLTYSDFGYFTSTNVQKLRDVSITGSGVTGTDNGSNHSTTMLFAGGYDILPAGTKPGAGAQFTGTAIGIVNASINGGTGEASGAKKALYEHSLISPGTYNQSEMARVVTKNATLTMGADGKPIIYMPFGSDAFLAKDVRDNGDIQWYDVTVENGHFTFAVPEGMNADEITKRFSHDNDMGDNPTELVNDGYYGVTTPVEATGTVVYGQTHDLGNDVTREFNFQGAYGMVPGTPAAH